MHHKDRNKLNNNFDNLEVLCKSCHAKEHQYECRKQRFKKGRIAHNKKPPKLCENNCGNFAVTNNAKYCKECRRKIISEHMKINNPMNNIEIKEKARINMMIAKKYIK